MIVFLTIAKTVKIIKITEQNHSQNCPDCIGPASAIGIGIKLSWPSEGWEWTW